MGWTAGHKAHQATVRQWRHSIQSLTETQLLINSPSSHSFSGSLSGATDSATWSTHRAESMITAASVPSSILVNGPPSSSSVHCRSRRWRNSSSVGVFPVCQFPAFLPREVEDIKDPFARKLAARIERLPVQVSFSDSSIMSSFVKPEQYAETNPPLLLLHGFDRYTLPLLEEAGLETWALDILGWGFSDLKSLPPCNVASKCDHLYQFWKSYIKRPMIIVGPSLGAAVAIEFTVSHPEAVEKLILMDASVYAEGTGDLAKLPKALAYAGVYVLKSILLRLYATSLTFNSLAFSTLLDWTNIGRLHCLLPWWEEATVDFMTSGGYNVVAQIEQVKQKTLIIWGENDQIIDSKLAVRLHSELPNAIIRQIPDCGHLPHVEKPAAVCKLIKEFVVSTV